MVMLFAKLKISNFDVNLSKNIFGIFAWLAHLTTDLSTDLSQDFGDNFRVIFIPMNCVTLCENL